MKRIVLLMVLVGCDSGGGEGEAADAATADGAIGGEGGGGEGGGGSGGATDMAVESPDAAVGGTNVPGKFVRTLEVSGETREFIVYVPEAAAGDTPVPVVFMFHGTSGDGEKFYNTSKWKEKADEEGFIAVFPSALLHCFYEDENRDGDFDDEGELKVTTKWDGGHLGTDWPLCAPEVIAMLPPARRAEADHPVADDLGFVDAMLDHLATEQAVDTRRIYASGFSNGGQFTSRLAVDRSDRFAALAAAAGSMAVEPIPPARAVPFAFTVGELDDRFTSALMVPALPLDETIFEVMAPIVGRYLTALQLSDTHTSQTVMAGPRAIFRSTFAESTAGGENQFVFAVLEGLFHQYPNGENYAIRLVDPLWDFFSQYSLP